MKPKHIYYIITTIVYIAFVVKLATLMIAKPQAGWNLFIEWFFMATIIAACCWSIYAIRQADPDSFSE
jgi:uncharacterized protein with PQ loop repeat